MTPAQHARKLGVELKTVSEVSGVPLRTLQRWKTTKPFVFAAVCEKVGRDKCQWRSEGVLFDHDCILLDEKAASSRMLGLSEGSDE